MQEMGMQNVQRLLANHAIYLLHPLEVKKIFCNFEHFVKLSQVSQCTG